jgi:hypothetical protein
LSEANTAAKAAAENEPAEDEEMKLPADTTNTEPAQVEQLIDTLLNFAPLAELEAPLQKTDLDQLLRLRFSQVIAQRYLAREDFANARKFMTPAEWGLRAEGIEKLTREAAQATNPGDRAQKFLQLGDAWAAARKQLLNVPLDTRETREKIFAGEESSAGVLRRENGKALLPAADLDAELEGREELRHASVYWLKAADAQPGSDVAATALWRALRAIPVIADVSAYSLKRAQETMPPQHQRGSSSACAASVQTRGRPGSLPSTGALGRSRKRPTPRLRETRKSRRKRRACGATSTVRFTRAASPPSLLPRCSSAASGRMMEVPRIGSRF